MHDALDAALDDSLLPLLPLIYVAWADGEIAPGEAALIRTAAAELGADPAGLDRWLDPTDPPSAATLRGLAEALTRRAVASADGRTASDLAELGLALAPESDADSLQRVRDVAARLGLDEADAVTDLVDVPARGEGFGKLEPESLDPSPLTAWLERQRPADRAATRALLADDAFTHRYDQSIADKRAQTLDWLQRVAAAGIGRQAYPETAPEGALTRFVAAFETLAEFDVGLTVKCGVQFGLFAGSVRALGTEKHRAVLREAVDMTLPGCFAMTERGHGSNVRALETTATYDAERDAFVITTPDDFARKEWIGNAARDGRMATVFAQLVVDGVSRGVHAFLVPLRDADGALLPGVRIADCGPKMGLDGVDNGQIWFDDVVVPRDNLLDRFAQVHADGTYHSDIVSDGKRFFTMLGTLVGGRVSVAGAAVSVSRVALTIATRYALRRRQFGESGAQEWRILDYPSHQRRLLPRIAATYAISFAQDTLARDWGALDGDPDAETLGRELEARAAALKALATWHATDVIQECREACGGQGYAAHNRFAALKADSDIFTTFEGDNTVLMQLVARALLTEFRRQFADARVFGLVRHFAGRVVDAVFDRNPFVTARTDRDHLRDMGWHAELLAARQADLTHSLGMRLQKRLGQMSAFEAFTEVQNHALALADAYAERLVLDAMHRALDAFEGPAAQKALVTDLARLHGVHAIERGRAWFLENGYLDGGKARAVCTEVDALCAELRPHARTLVDGFAVPEKCLGPIARQPVRR